MCFNKTRCSQKHEKWAETLEFRIKKGEEIFEKLNIHSLDYFRSSYEILRKEMVNDQEIREALEFGWVIDAQVDWILVLAYVKTNNKFVPVHVKVQREQDDAGYWYISSAYYPTQEVWGENFDKKMCFCKKTEYRKVMVG